MSRVYNALTGAELKVIIMREIERAIDNAGINSIAITYPEVCWAWGLSVLQNTGETLERIVKAGDSILDLDSRARSEPDKVRLVSVQGDSSRFKHNPPSPTEVRESEDLPLPEA
jgi:hypothetical protein